MIKFLCDAYDLPRLSIEPQECLPATRCAMSGVPIATGYHVADITAKATADIADTFRVSSEWLSEPAARLFKANALMRGNLLALPKRGLRPFVALDSATLERPAWRDLLREIEIGAHVGKKRSCGWGAVASWSVQEIDEFTLSDGTRIRRPVPLAAVTTVLLNTPFDVEFGNLAGWTPPYWSPVCQTECAS